MSRTVFLHVGLPKSGTSYLQQTLTANREELAQAGLLFPGGAWVDQVRAVQDVRRLPLAGAKRRRVAGSWSRLVAEMAAWSGDAIVSMEWLGPASSEQVRRMVEDLAPARVQVIFTARDVARTVPAAWQEFMQNREVWSWPEFLDSVVAEAAPPGSPGARFWAQQDLATLLRSWADVLPVEDVHVVTVPPPGADPEVLWQRLCQVLGTPYPKTRSGSGSNTSLGMESAELMRRLNQRAREDRLPTPLYLTAFKHGLAKGVLAGRAREESRLVLPPAHHAWARREAARQIAAVRASGVNVVGDLEELQPVVGTAPGGQPDDVPAETLLEISLVGLVGTARRSASAKDSGQVRQLRAENARLRARLDELESRPWRAALGRSARSTRVGRAVLRRRRG